MSEQRQYLLKMGCHTSRYATTLGMLAEALAGSTQQNDTLRTMARLSYNWATYMTRADGVVDVGPTAADEVWFRIQLGAVTDMLHAMLLEPQWAPEGQSRMLRFASALVLGSVKYGPELVAYNSSGVPASETLKMAFEPARVLAGGCVLARREASERVGAAQCGWWSFDGATNLLTVHHDLSPRVRAERGESLWV